MEVLLSNLEPSSTPPACTWIWPPTRKSRSHMVVYSFDGPQSQMRRPQRMACSRRPRISTSTGAGARAHAAVSHAQHTASILLHGSRTCPLTRPKAITQMVLRMRHAARALTCQHSLTRKAASLPPCATHLCSAIATPHTKLLHGAWQHATRCALSHTPPYRTAPTRPAAHRQNCPRSAHRTKH